MATIPENMKAAVLVEPGKFEYKEVPVPSISDDDVLVKVENVGICGTDLHIFHGRYAAENLPMIPGHEFCGVIAKCGENVEHLKEGKRVVVDPNIACGNCYYCRRNQLLNCSEISQIGIGRDGAFAEYVSVPAHLALPVSTDTPPAQLATAEPIACVVRATRVSKVFIWSVGSYHRLQVQSETYIYR